MNVLSTTSAYAPTTIARASVRREAAPNVSADPVDTVEISHAARDLLARCRTATATSTDGRDDRAVFDTDQGLLELGIDAYFTPSYGGASTSDDLPPLLGPTQGNVDALTRHIETRMPAFLEKAGIPNAPAHLAYGADGDLELPSDYPHAAEFKAALATDPALDRELRTTAAIASHLVEMRKAIPFQREYAAASTRAQIDAVVAKYLPLLSGADRAEEIRLDFGSDGSLTATHDGKPLSVT